MLQAAAAVGAAGQALSFSDPALPDEEIRETGRSTPKIVFMSFFNEGGNLFLLW